MNTDAELLRRYIEQESESAFAELVQRHIGLVYSVALRRVGGDAQLAEDVTQTVFNDLASKGAKLRTRATLGGWLYLSANLASAAIVRRERRRKAREIAAHDMQHMLSSPEPDWTHLRPVIDDAIVALKEEEREAVVLRFFEKQSFSEIGAALKVTEEAARKRVDRALEKLRATLERRGVTSTATALGIVLTTSTSTSAPTGLAAKISGHAMAMSGAATGSAIHGGWLGLALPTAAVLVIGGLVLGQRHANDELRQELDRFSADRAALASLLADNRELVRSLAAVEALRTSAAAPLPPLPARITAAQSATRPIAATVSVTANGLLRWNDDYVSLADFISRMRQIKATADPESRIHVRAPGAGYSAIAYVMEEARKAGIDHLTVEASVKSGDTFPLWIF